VENSINNLTGKLPTADSFIVIQSLIEKISNCNALNNFKWNLIRSLSMQCYPKKISYPVLHTQTNLSLLQAV
jgi:hypothetical protein